MSQYIHYGVGIRFLDDFRFSPEILIIGRQHQLHLMARELVKTVQKFSNSSWMPRLLSLIIRKFASLLKLQFRKIESLRMRYLYGFSGLAFKESFPQSIPRLRIGRSYDLVGDFAMFTPLWINEFSAKSQSICFAPLVLDAARDYMARYKSKVPGKKVLGVHLRRGDYLDCASLCLSSEYYKMALDRFLSSEWSLLIFSDDIAYCMKQSLFSGYYVDFSTVSSDVLDMALMSLCDGLVIANSTFSLWGGLMGDRAGRPVVCPKQFFGERDSFHSQINGQWFPSTWTSIDICN